jgi:hypothetical protein
MCDPVPADAPLLPGRSGSSGTAPPDNTVSGQESRTPQGRSLDLPFGDSKYKDFDQLLKRIEFDQLLKRFRDGDSERIDFDRLLKNLREFEQLTQQPNKN